jgi:hypothetical protein
MTDTPDMIPRAEAERMAQARGTAALEEAAGIAQFHLSLVEPHHPDKPKPDRVAQGYGNASLNIREAILARADEIEGVK